MENGYAWFVTDFLALIASKHEISKQPFLHIKLRLLSDYKAIMEVSDGNTNILYTQKYVYTNAEREFGMYFTDNVLLLEGEY